MARIGRDKYGVEIHIGDEVIYTFQQQLRKGKVARITPQGKIVVDNWPTGSYITGHDGMRRWHNAEIAKSLGWKECVKMYPTYVVNRPKVEIKQTER